METVAEGKVMLYKPRMRGALFSSIRGVVLVSAGLASVACLAAGFAACSSGADTLRVTVGPGVVFPHGVADKLDALTLVVYETADGVDCAADGTTTGPTSRAITTKALQSGGCATGVKFCGDVSLAQSDSARVFFAVGLDADKNLLTNGCTKAVINRDEVPIDITMRRFFKPASCGNAAVEPTEQCEKGDSICDSACHTSEVYLSGGDSDAKTGTANGKSGDKMTPFFLWPPASGASGKFVAVFGDKTPPAGYEVTMRVLSDAFARNTGNSSEMDAESFFLPNDNSAQPPFPPKPTTGNQYAPAAAFDGAHYDVVFQDEAGGNADISLRSMTPSFQALQGTTPVWINGPSGTELGAQVGPAVSLGTNGLLFVAWTDTSTGAPPFTSGNVAGRTYDPKTQARGVERVLSTGTGSSGVALAALAGTGGAADAGVAAWVVTWQSGGNVKMRLLGPDGAPLGPEQTVNDPSHAGPNVHPSVASLSDGRFAIVWNDRAQSGGDIFLQRYTADGQRIAGDQVAPLNDVVIDGDQNSPVIAGESAMGGSYVAAWVDKTSGQVRGRFIGGTAGFLFNHVDGQETEFQTSVAAGRSRANPTVAAGGARPFVAIGWEDTSQDSTPGIYGRRFPVGE